MGKGKFGGVKINFAGQNASMSKVFGTKPIAPSQMTKVMWGFIKKNKLMKK